MESPEGSTFQPRNRYFLGLDLVLIPVAAVLSFAIRFEGLQWDPATERLALLYVALLLPIKILVFLKAGLYKRLWSYAGIRDVERILLAVLLAGFLSFVVGAMIIPTLGWAASRVPLSVLTLDVLLTAAFVALPRMGARLAYRERRRENHRGAQRALIAGAGIAGARIATELRANPEYELDPIGFLDDDQSKHGQHLAELPVLGALSELPEIARGYQVGELIIALPGAHGMLVRKLVGLATEAGIKTRTVPRMEDVISGRVQVNALRPVEIHDLLRREPVTTDLQAVKKLVVGETVLVTGAGGSIGSELCRQLSQFSPRRIVLLGHGENSIFEILQELEGRFPKIDFIPVIADIRDRERLLGIHRMFAPAALFHSAAHKHVPMMEHNVAEAITNNVLGTRNVVEVAALSGVGHLVCLSTDKAIRPTSIMGATKRVAEQIVQHTALDQEKDFVAVRFGNVLGSRGSVLPIFLRQIEAGGPVTVTHPEMRRYFMTIPEAVELVLQAGALGCGGEVFVLDMGEQVRIADLAADLIRLSGKEVGTDIEICYTGIRPGEKLYEEIFLTAENAEPTHHPKILRARNAELPIGVAAGINDLIVAAQSGRSDEELCVLLKRLVPDFIPFQAEMREAV